MDGDDGDQGKDESDATVIMISLLVKSQGLQPQVPTRRPAFPEIHQRLRQWEGLGGR